MDIEKLSLQPQELDKHTGRIIIPKSKEELDQLASTPLTPSRHTSSVRTSADTSQRQSPAPMIPPVPQSRGHVRGQSSGNRSALNEDFADYPRASRSEAGPSVSFLTQLKIMGICQLLIVLPLALVVIFLLNENRAISSQYDSLNSEFSNIKNRGLSKHHLQGSGSNTLEKELGALRNQIFELNSTMEQFEVVIDEPLQEGQEQQSELQAEAEVEFEDSVEVAAEFESGEEEPQLESEEDFNSGVE